MPIGNVEVTRLTHRRKLLRYMETAVIRSRMGPGFGTAWRAPGYLKG